MSEPRIVMSPYDDSWPAAFDAVRVRLADALGDIALRIDHIGSTSVPGLAAKDVIDVQLSVAHLDDPRLAPALARLGVTPTEITADHVPPGCVPARGDWEKRYYRPPSDWRPTHLHVRVPGRANHRYALLFRDYLRHSHLAAGAYAQVKVALARLHPDDVEAYYAVKDPACDLVMDAAQRWAAEVGWSAPT